MSMTTIQNSLKSLFAPLETEEQLHKTVRCFRQREQVRLIWRDLNRFSDMRTTTRELSWLADACVEQTMNWLYQQASERWGKPIGRESKSHTHGGTGYGQTRRKRTEFIL